MREALAAGRSPEVVEAIHAPIDRVEVHPPAGGPAGLRPELVGHLASMLRAAGVGGGNAQSPLADANGLDVFSRSELVDAGTRNRRSQYITVAI